MLVSAHTLLTQLIRAIHRPTGVLQTGLGLNERPLYLQCFGVEVEFAERKLGLQRLDLCMVGNQLGHLRGGQLRLDHRQNQSGLHMISDPWQPSFRRWKQTTGNGRAYRRRSPLWSDNLPGQFESAHERSFRDRLVQRADLPLLLQQERHKIGWFIFRGRLSRVQRSIFVGVDDQFTDIDRFPHLWAVDDEPKAVRPRRARIPFRHEKAVAFGCIQGQVLLRAIRSDQMKCQRTGPHRFPRRQNGDMRKELRGLAANQMGILHEELDL